MNIAMMQQLAPKVGVQKQTATQNTQTTQTSNAKNEKFGAVFSEVIASKNKPVQQQDTQTSNAESVEAVLSADSLEELLDVLQIPHDEAVFFVEINGNAVAVDEMMNTEDLAAALGMDVEDLMAIVEELLGEELQTDDVWAMIEQAPNLLAQVMAALQGEHQVPPQDAEKIVEFLKLAQLVGSKTDSMYNQEMQLPQLKESFQQIMTQVQQLLQQEAPKTPVIQQVVQQIVQQTVKQEVDTTQINATQHQQLTTPTKTVTLTLPAERPAQSEALLKEIQNLINRSQMSNTQGTMKLMLKLYPENLGSIRIEIMQRDGVLTARLLATTTAGKELLDSNLHQLKTAFVAQNIQMERIDVAQSLQDAERNMRDQSFFNNFFKQQSNEEQETDDDEKDDDEKSFSDFLNEEV
ncbi:flagellar hook-length control protein FliK [Solibacillus sp. CAU 1738]|uniref:flagellar hook-length control protein FliK n=1 Tax=Solibacillus sp. CAU 1738 TaxID=3140363 RepID=UPI003260CBA3